MRRAHSCWWLSKTAQFTVSSKPGCPQRMVWLHSWQTPCSLCRGWALPRSCSPHILTLSWISQAQGGCPAENGTDGQPGPCPEYEGSPAPTFTGRAAKHLETKPGEEQGAPGWFSAGQGKAPGCWGRGNLTASLRKAALMPKKAVSILALRQHSTVHLAGTGICAGAQQEPIVVHWPCPMAPLRSCPSLWEPQLWQPLVLLDHCLLPFPGKAGLCMGYHGLFGEAAMPWQLPGS